MKKYQKVVMYLAILVCLVAALVLWLFYCGILGLDHSGIRRADSFIWNDTLYVYAPGRYTHEGKILAKTNAGDNIIEVDEDKTHTFLVLRDFLDDDLYMREDYEIPTSGEITKAVWAHQGIKDPVFCSALSEILENTNVDFQYETDAPWGLSNKQTMYELYVGYEDCPIATCNLGYMGIINGTWYITTNISRTSSEQYLLSCSQIPQAYIPILKPYLR